MEVFFIKALQLLLSLAILVVLHELGHFIPAKIFKTRVEKFYLFFDPWFSIFKKKIGETVYGIGWLPLGGYVKISGMIDESMDKEQMSKPPQPWEFRSKPTWQRFIIMIGGVTVNIALGFFIYMMIIAFWGKEAYEPDGLKNSFYYSEPMKKIGFEDGDLIVEIDGKKIEYYEPGFGNIYETLAVKDVKQIGVLNSNGDSRNIVIPDEFGKEIIRLSDSRTPPFQSILVSNQIDSIVPNSIAFEYGFQEGDIISSINGIKTNSSYDINEIKKSNNSLNFELKRNTKVLTKQVLLDEQNKTIGVYFKPVLPKTITIKYGFFESVVKGYEYGLSKLTNYVSSLKLIASKEGVKQLGGFGTIGNIFPAKWDWKRFWEMTAFISIILGVMNLLPIPALDGGHLVFLTYEMVTGKKPNQRFLEIAQMVGIILLLGLFFYANIMDIFRFL